MDHNKLANLELKKCEILRDANDWISKISKEINIIVLHAKLNNIKDTNMKVL